MLRVVLERHESLSRGLVVYARGAVDVLAERTAHRTEATPAGSLQPVTRRGPRAQFQPRRCLRLQSPCADARELIDEGTQSSHRTGVVLQPQPDSGPQRCGA